MLLHATHCAWPVAFWKVPAAHSSQLPESALAVPTLHAMHTPALAPPQPLRASPASAQSAHAEHDSAPTAALNVEGGHASQCDVAFVRGAAALALPRLPIAHASQLVEPALAWYVPSAHSSQVGALAMVLERPTSHGAQPRSAVAVGGTVTNSPLAQTACFVQKPLPARGWNSSAPHARHASALLALEEVPASHGAHTRSDVALGAKRSRSPGMQVACFVHDACPVSGWNALLGHALQVAAFVVTEIVPAAHGRQLRSAVAFGSDATRSPLAHAVCGRQKPLPDDGW